MATLRDRKQQRLLDVEGNHKRNFVDSNNEAVSWIEKISEGKKSAEELVRDIISEIEAPPIYYKHVKEICNNLNQIMKFFYKPLNVRIVVFGSSATKLAFRGSDVDIYLDFGGNLPEPPDKLVRTLKNKVRKFGYFFKTIPIFARVPIVHCIHRTKICCDLSFSNAIGVENSHLIKFLLSRDNRIRPLILTLKYLMKIKGLLGQHAFTSYAIICLVVFFLQVLENPVVPAIHYLQSLANERKIVADWDVSFTTEVSHLPTINNQLLVPELLQEFFEFYSTFEFGFYVISLFIAKKQLKPIFSDPNLLPNEFHLYKANLAKNESFKFDYNKFMCVQGPFNHSNNITRTVNQKSLIQFQELCSSCASTGQDLLGKNRSEESKMKFLMSILNQINEEPKNKKAKKEEVIIFVGENVIFGSGGCTEEALRDKWSEHIFSEVQNILCKVMKCDMDIQSRASDNETISSFNVGKLIKCKLPYIELITKIRNVAKSELEFPSNISLIEKEEIISNYLCNTVLKGAKNLSLKFEISCIVRKKPTRFCMNFESKELQKPNFPLVQQVLKFIQNYFPKWIK